MKKKVFVLGCLLCFVMCISCSSVQKKPNCEELKKACAQAVDLCDIVEPLTGEETAGLRQR